MTTIQIQLNGSAHTLPSGTNLQRALALLRSGASPADAPLATALNGTHVARAQRAQVVLNDGDQITTFEPITGG